MWSTLVMVTLLIGASRLIVECACRGNFVGLALAASG